LLGIDPASLLVFINNVVNDEREPRLEGILPVREFSFRARVFSLVSEPVVDTEGYK